MAEGGDGLLLAAVTPAAWLDQHLAAHYDVFGGAEDAAAAWLSIDRLLADDAANLRHVHQRLVDDGAPPAAAATYVAAWTGGMLADAVGFGLATASAGFEVDAAAVRFHQRSSGWSDRVDLSGAAVVVAAGHPWAGQPQVETVATTDEVRDRAVSRLVEVARPLVDACHSLAKVGKAGLWNEVADGLGMSVAYQPLLPVRSSAVESLTEAVRVDGVPWKSRPRVDIVDGRNGPVFVAQKGGCCLAYTRADIEVRRGIDEMDDEEREYRERFPHRPGTPHYCSTCSLLPSAECQARQLFWIERRQPTPAATTD